MPESSPQLLPVKPYRQTPGMSTCGPASLKMVLEYYGVQADELELAKLAGTTFELGSDDTGIKRAAEASGFIAEIHNEATFNEIQHWLDKKIPVIVNWFTRGRQDDSEEDVPTGHYSVVVGLDEKYIYLQDPELAKIRRLTRENFMSVWFDYTQKNLDAWDEIILRQLIAVYR